MPERIYYKREGEGKKLVLIHGFCETGEVWNKITPLLSKEMEVITPDLPGFGRSGPAPDVLTIDIISKLISDWLKTITDEEVVVMGHSLGGYIALALAENHPEQLMAYGLINSTAFSDDDIKKDNREKTVEFLKKHGKDVFLDSFVPGLFYDNKSDSSQKLIREARAICDHSTLEGMISYTLAMKDRPSRIHLLGQDMPVLFIAGKDDTVVSEEKSQEQMEMIENGQYYFLDKSAHMAMMEQPEELARLIKVFVNQLGLE